VTSLRIEMQVDIERPVAAVFAAWSSSEGLASWFAPMAIAKPLVEMDFVIDGRYRIEMHLPDGVIFTTRGEFRDIVRDRKIVMTWHCDAFPDPASLVTVDFSPTPAGTRVALVHEQFESGATRDDHRHGWEACLAELARVLNEELNP
jgi:uncharacterized protein YndB with AHSA1/START domain